VHTKNTCKIWADTYNVDEVIPLVKDPKFICKRCWPSITTIHP